MEPTVDAPTGPSSGGTSRTSADGLPPDASADELRRLVDVLAGIVDRQALRTRDAYELARTRRLDVEQANAQQARLEVAFATFARRRSVRLVTQIADLARRLRGRETDVVPDMPVRATALAPEGALPRLATPVETGTIGATDPTPDLLSGLSPRSYRETFLRRLDTTGANGLRIVASASASASAATATKPGAGWPDVFVVDQPDFDIRQLPRHIVTVARLAASLAPWLTTEWFDQFDVVIAADDAAAAEVRAASSKTSIVAADARSQAPDGPAVRDALRLWATARRFAIMVQTVTWEGSATSGDYFYARALQRQLERRGHPTSVYLLRQWPLPATSREDVVIHLWGRYPLTPRSGQVNALWVLYHPDLVVPELLSRYDHVFAGSDAMAATLGAMTAVPVEPLHQAADPERLASGGIAPHHELLFIGNSRGARRTILDDVGPTAHDLAVYGGGWESDLLDPRFLRGESVRHSDLGSHYRAADIVLNDHWPTAAEAELITNRVYDVLAAGGFAMSDPVAGLDAEFDGGVVTYSSPADLALKIERYLADPDARRAIAERGRAAVLARHTFTVRVDRLVRVLLPMAEDGANDGPPA